MSRRGLPPVSAVPLQQPLVPIKGLEDEGEEELSRFRSREVKPGNCWKIFGTTLGTIAFLGVILVIGVGVWRFFGVQNDMNKLNTRLLAAEALLVNHTTRLGTINATLITTTARAVQNTGRIDSLNTTVESHDVRITSLENRTTHVEDRITLAEAKLLAVMNNVTILQAEMIQAQQDIVTIMADIVVLQQNATDHLARIQVLEAANIQNVINIQNLVTWLQGNLTLIDGRFNALNTTYTVTASGSALVTSGTAIPAPVTWETRSLTITGGLHIEYLWISDTASIPTLILESPSSGYSFRIGNWTATNPVNSLPAPSTPLSRPLSASQRAKFMFTENIPNPNAAVLAARWNNQEATLDFVSNLVVFDAVTIIAPLTFVIGFL